jgi:hypothetical protein
MSMEKSATDRACLLRTWASLGAELTASRSRAVPDWSAVRRMIDAVRPKMEDEAKRLRLMLDESRRKLAPLGEPFDLDLGLHRWLDAEREEAYSDWLEWVVRQAKTPARVFPLFGLEAPGNLPGDAVLNVKREVCVPRGHIDQEGRLDLVIYFGDRTVIVVEVKKGDAEDSDTAKHAGYRESHVGAEHVLLAVSADEQDYDGFKPCLWGMVCIEMRRLAIELRNEQRIMAAAMVLAFAAAVEQNLLGFSADLVRSIGEDRFVFFNPRIIDHVQAFLKTQEP